MPDKYESLIRYLYGAFNGKLALTVLCVLVCIGLLMCAARWRLFKKAGEKG